MMQGRVIDWCVSYMLSFGNANVGDLYVNRRLLENGAIIRKLGI